MFQKHLSLTLDLKFNFLGLYKVKLLGPMRIFQPVLPRLSLLTVYKTFIRSQLNYDDVIYVQAYNSSFYKKLESIQYKACQ